MTKIKSKIITLALLTLITAVLLISNTTNVNAAAADTKSQSISALNSVMGITTDSYSITQNTKQDNLYGAPQEKVDSFFTSQQGSFRATFSYTKGYLNQIYFSDIKGNVQTCQQKTSYTENSKQFLNNFGKYTGDSIYNQFASMLNNVEPGKDASITTKNVNLKIINHETSSSITWTYVDSNGISADQKHVAFEYENGQLVTFVNTWQLYKVSGTPKVSTDQANSLAFEASKTFSYEATVDNKTQQVTGFSIDQKSLGQTAISYSNFYEPKSARDSDPFTLYPLWHIFLGFDKFYPGDVSGMDVYIWGDTGKIAGMHEYIVDSGTGDSASATDVSQGSDSLLNNNSIFSVSVLLTGLASIVLVSPIYCKRFKRARFFNRKFLATLFSGLVLLSLVLTATSQVNAASKSRIYSIGDCSNGLNGYFNNDADHAEALATADVCNYVGNLTQDRGYDTSNLYGAGTIDSDVYSQANFDEYYYDNTILLHLGHFAFPKGHYYQDVTGNSIKDRYIYDETGSQKHNFVFLWVCNGANNLRDNDNNKVLNLYDGTTANPGLPIAWTHRDGQSQRTLLNYDGYNFPDYEGQCYVSFYGMSPMLSGLSVVPQTFQQTTPYNPTNCKEFIKHFYDHALTEYHSVKESLNLASWDYFGCSLYDSPLSPDEGKGYNCWWPGSTRVDLPPDVLDFIRSHGLDESGWYPEAFPKMWDIPDNPSSYRPNQMKVHGDSSIHIYKTKNLTVSSNGGGSTSPAAGVHPSIINSVVTVTATPASLTSKVLNYWLLDGTQNLGNALSVDIPIGTSDHTLSANFIDAPSPFYPYAYHIESYTDIQPLISQQRSLTGFQPDGYYAEIQSNGDYEAYGQITASMNTAATGHVWVYGYGSGTLQVDVSNNGGGGQSLGSTAFTSSPHWIDCGIAWSPFNIIGLTASAYISDLHIDSIKVTPIMSYTLTVNSATGGTTTPSAGAQSYNETSVVNVQASPSSGYYFDYWLRNNTNVGSSNPIAVTMNNNYVLTPVFTRYSLTISSTTGGSTNPTSDIYYYTIGQTQTVTATAATGYRFDHWVLDDNQNAGTSDTITVTMNRARTLQAIFSPLATYTLTVDAWCDEGFQVYPVIYIDGYSYAGTASVTVYAGYHTIAVEDPYYDCFYVGGFSDGLWNGASRNILSNTHITAGYYRAW